MADHEQQDQPRPRKDSGGFFRSFKSKFSRTSSKSTKSVADGDPDSSSSAAVASPERLEGNLSDYPSVASSARPPLPPIFRCRNGKFHSQEGCTGNCSTIVPVDLAGLEKEVAQWPTPYPRRPTLGSDDRNLADPLLRRPDPANPADSEEHKKPYEHASPCPLPRRPSELAGFSDLPPVTPEQPSKHRYGPSTSSIDIHAQGSAAALRRGPGSRRPTNTATESIPFAPRLEKEGTDPLGIFPPPIPQRSRRPTNPSEAHSPAGLDLTTVRTDSSGDRSRIARQLRRKPATPQDHIFPPLHPPSGAAQSSSYRAPVIPQLAGRPTELTEDSPLNRINLGRLLADSSGSPPQIHSQLVRRPANQAADSQPFDARFARAPKEPSEDHPHINAQLARKGTQHSDEYSEIYPQLPRQPRRTAADHIAPGFYTAPEGVKLPRDLSPATPSHPSERSDSLLSLIRTPSQEIRIQGINDWRNTSRLSQLSDMASRPESMLMPGGPREFKNRAQNEARVAQQTIDRFFEQTDHPLKGKYEFRELIGKGTYGRVFKSLERSSGRIVAVKVLSPDEEDSKVPTLNRDFNLSETLKEIHILERLKQSGATNVNGFIEAGTVHSQIWIVSEYCSGGSLNTLKRATNDKVGEDYIRPVARELARGIHSIHRAGVVHRDIKCANVMISETGSVAIIDFGVSNILQSNLEEDKRKTIIGTIHWMPPEVQFDPNTTSIPHGAEVDVWAYGMTLYELAMGRPPHGNIKPLARLRHEMRTNPPRLPDNVDFSADLKDLIAFCCNVDKAARPTMEQVCQHPYVAGSEHEYPTSILQGLVEIYYNWEASGGNRRSLWVDSGAAAANIPEQPVGPGQDEWVFSTTADFDRMHGDAGGEFDLSTSPPREADEWDDDVVVSQTLRPEWGAGDAAADRSEQDERVRRGGKALAGLFDQSAKPYKLGERPTSDLPLRSGDAGSSLHHKELSVSSNDDGTPQINLDAIDGKKEKKRATMAWKWNDNLPAGEESMPPTRPVLQHAKTFAMGEVATAPTNRGTLDLDALLNPGAGAQPGAGARETLDLDALLGGGAVSSAGPAVTQTPLAATMGGPKPSMQDVRQTLDLDALMGDMGGLSSPSLAPAFTYDEPTSTETMRPATHYREPSLQQQPQFQGHDFAQQQQHEPQYGYGLDQSAAHSRQVSQQPRPSTLDLDALMGGADQSMLDAMMAGDNEYEGPTGAGPATGATTTDDGTGVADYATIRPDSTRASIDNLGFATSPPRSSSGSPFGGPLDHLPSIPDYPAPVNPMALRNDAPLELMQSEMLRLLSTFSQALDVNHAYLTEASQMASAARNSGPSQSTHWPSSSIASQVHDEGAEGDREDE